MLQCTSSYFINQSILYYLTAAVFYKIYYISAYCDMNCDIIERITLEYSSDQNIEL